MLFMLELHISKSTLLNGNYCLALDLKTKDKSQLSNALRNNLEGYIHCNSKT